MSSVILNARGNPEPPTDIQKRISNIHERLSLRFLEGTLKSHWAIIMEWAKNDKRRRWIKEENMDPDRAYDIIGYLPVDCSVDEAAGYLAKTFRTFPREDVQNLLDRLDKFNAGVASEASEKATSEVLDAADPSKDSGPSAVVEVVEDVEPEEKKKPSKKKSNKKEEKSSSKSKYL